MKWLGILVFAAALAAACVTGAVAWTEDFESYSGNVASPWIQAASGDPQMNISDGYGWDGSKGIFANDPWAVWLYSGRATDYTGGAAYVMTIKAKLGGGALSRNFWSLDSDTSVGGVAIYAEMNNANNNIEYGWWVGGVGGKLWNVAVLDNVWYEARMTVTPTGASWTHEFATRSYDGAAWSNWTVQASGDVGAELSGFAPSYVVVGGLWAEEGTVMDDISAGAVPEPSGLLALGPGVLGLVGFATRRRR